MNRSCSRNQVSRTVFLVTIFALLVAMTPFFTPLLQQLAKAQKSVPVVDQIVNTPANTVKYFTFSVPQDAINPRLTGTYEVHGGIIPAVNLYIVDQSQCPDPLNTQSCSGGAYTDSGKSLGQVDAPLTPGRTYYVIFENIAPLGESKQTVVHFTLNSS
jgi:hypothetical protein